ncbi:hypothetical protein FJZ33_10500, partial [Candidatus Poribacteria bacterium]|nr:hypothetical protein [Candidatus Poribacteria bacterium]
TSGGVSRFDGKGFTNFTTKNGLVDDWVNSIYSEVDGSIWFGTWKGISRYDGKKFVSFTTQQGLSSNLVNFIYGDPDGTIWFGTGWTDYPGGISIYDGKKFSTFKIPDHESISVTSICRDKNGILWFGSFGNGVFRYDGNNMVNLTSKDGLSNNYIISVCASPDGALWFGTLMGGVSRYDGKGFYNLTTKQGLVNNTVSCIHCDPDGVLWFGTGFLEVPGGGISRYDGQSFVNFTIYHGLAHNSVRSIYRDPDGIMWIGTEGGVSQYDANLDKKYLTKLETSNNADDYSYYTLIDPKIILISLIIILAIIILILEIYKRRVFKPIPNPYIAGDPVISEDMFFGRKEEFEFIRNCLFSAANRELEKGVNQSGRLIVLTGERRNGKTSILMQIRNGELGKSYIPVLISLPNTTFNNKLEFFENMGKEINSSLVKAGFIETPFIFQHDVVNDFQQFIAESTKKLGDKSLLLMFDEYERIESGIDDGIIPTNIVDIFVNLMESSPNLAFIFVGLKRLAQMNPSYWNSLIGKSIYRHIGFLPYEDSLKLIIEPLKGKVKFPRGVPEIMFRFTAGQPFSTQLLCKSLVERLNETHKSKVSQDDIHILAKELVDKPLPQMTYFWDRLNHEQRTALSLM